MSIQFYILVPKPDITQAQIDLSTSSETTYMPEVIYKSVDSYIVEVAQASLISSQDFQGLRLFSEKQMMRIMED